MLERTESTSWVLAEQYQVRNNRALLCFSAVGILTNTLLLFRFFKNRRSIDVSSAALVHISLCDLALVIMLCICCGAHELSPNLSWNWCQFNGFSVILFIVPSALTFTAISVERYVQIIQGRPISKTFLQWIIFISWLVSAILASIPIFTGKLANTSSLPYTNEKSRSAYEQQLKLTMRLALLTLYFHITWLGTCCSYLYQVISGQEVSPDFDFYASMLSSGASAVNPLLVMRLDSRWSIKLPVVSCWGLQKMKDTAFMWKVKFLNSIQQ
ncbi:hypothetical protein BKA69DRAFT_684773 [Paraphysoderma sedebokerense]|nr:hypothetical protein BKA69DRAFT_684773 [Paraphysoderma sedebokerense]